MVMFPSLSGDSWVSDIDSVVDILFAQVFCTDYSQDGLFLGRVSSVSKVIQDSGNDLNATISALTSMFNTYFSAYFPTVAVDISQTANSIATGSSAVDLQIYIQVTDTNGSSSILSKVFSLPEGRTNAVLNVINN